ncbi:TIGR02677 family protein [Haliangium sp.]|uniref:TIGR02677 family protein n=1 Tax=Haliangium sp. TaxID=2663208 RepID=UPI003D11AF9C
MRADDPSSDRGAPGHHGQLPRRSLEPILLFQYVTVQNAPTYRAIMQVFYEAKQHYTIELRPVELLERLQGSEYHVDLGDDDALDRALDQLVHWGNLMRTRDNAAVSHIEEFYRKRYLYTLSGVGEAAHRAILEVEATIGKSGALQTTMLVKIRDTLDALARQLATPAPDPRALVGLFHDLHAAFDTLTQEANRFIGELGRHDGEQVDLERFATYKEAVRVYISRFVGELRRLSPEIVARLRLLDAASTDQMVTIAASAADLPPAGSGRDPEAMWIAEQRARWEGVRTWFVGSSNHPEATVDRLANVAIDAVLNLARVLARLNERRTRPVDRAADYRTLARWFTACETDEDAHRLWHMATGLYASRHFHIAEEDSELTTPHTSWWDAAPVSVPIRLRTRGATSNSGRPSPAADYSAEKRWIARIRRREREQVAAAMRRFEGRGPMDFRGIEHLDATEFDLLLSLLDQALVTPRAEDGARTARTADGRLQVTLHPPGADDTSLVVLETPRGRLRCRNYRIEVTSAFTASSPYEREERQA